MNDDREPERYSDGDTQARRYTAKDMMGRGGACEMLRNLVENECGGLVREDYGISLDEARLSIQCAELASLPAWDVESMIEAATVYQSDQIRIIRFERARRPERALHAIEVAEEMRILDEITRIKRRIKLAILRDNSPESLNSADAVFLLERAGVRLFHELREAVQSAVFFSDGDVENENRCRRLAGMQPFTQGEAKRLYPDDSLAVAAQPAPASEPMTPAARRAALDMTGQRGARRRILEEWSAIEAEYGPRADAREVMRLLKRNKDEKEVQLKTVQNHLSDLRAKSLIP